MHNDGAKRRIVSQALPGSMRHDMSHRAGTMHTAATCACAWSREHLLMRTNPIKRSKHHKWKRAMRGQKMNWEIIVNNLAEAGADITCIIEDAGDPAMNVRIFKSHIEHILHHVLFAWNARHMDIDRYAQMSDEDFTRCSWMHEDLVPLGFLFGETKPERRSGKFDRGNAKRHLERHLTKSEREFTWVTRRHRKKKARQGG